MGLSHKHSNNDSHFICLKIGLKHNQTFFFHFFFFSFIFGWEAVDLCDGTDCFSLFIFKFYSGIDKLITFNFWQNNNSKNSTTIKQGRSINLICLNELFLRNAIHYQYSVKLYHRLSDNGFNDSLNFNGITMHFNAPYNEVQINRHLIDDTSLLIIDNITLSSSFRAIHKTKVELKKTKLFSLINSMILVAIHLLQS